MTRYVARKLMLAIPLLWGVVTLIFILVSTGLGLIMGRLGDIYGRKLLYVVGFFLFTAAAGASAISGSLPELLGGRVLQAIGSSMVPTPQAFSFDCSIAAVALPCGVRARSRTRCSTTRRCWPMS